MHSRDVHIYQIKYASCLLGGLVRSLGNSPGSKPIPLGHDNHLCCKSSHLTSSPIIFPNYIDNKKPHLLNIYTHREKETRSLDEILEKETYSYEHEEKLFSHTN